jgi:FkbM family methyltransferase
MFLLGEARGGTGRYSLPSGHMIVLRHGTRDLEIVDEVLTVPHAYEPPPGIASHLGGPLRILDLGANIGTFGVFALGRWNVDRMVSFEPDPANAAMLNNTIALNRANDCWTAHQAAVSNSLGHMTFIPGYFSQSRRADQGEAGIDVTMVDLFTLAKVRPRAACRGLVFGTGSQPVSGVLPLRDTLSPKAQLNDDDRRRTREHTGCPSLGC